MTNQEKLKQLVIDVFLLESKEFHFELMKENVDTWDSLGIVALAVGVQETFGYHFRPEEATAIKGIPDLIKILESKGITFDE